MTEKEKNHMKKTVFSVLIVAMFALSMIISTMSTNIQNDPPETFEEFVKDSWKWMRAPLVSATNQSPGAGTPGIVDIYIVNDTFSDWTGINENDPLIYEETNGSFVDDETGAPHPNLVGTTPYECKWHVAVVYQFNKSQAYDNGAWNASRVKAWYNSSGAMNGDASSVVMSESAWYAGDDADTQRITFYLLDTDGGADDGTSFETSIDSQVTHDVKIYYLG